SLSGQLAHFALGPADVTRGGFSLPAPLSAPQERGPLVASPFPAYSIDAGISEFGLGWQTNLAITRTRIGGDIDFVSDDLSGPWGRMTPGGDGYWYPVGLREPVRVQLVGADIIAYLPDGSRFTFGGDERIETAGRGTYAWLLREAETVTGRKT